MGTDLATLEAAINRAPAPKAANLTGWRIAGHTDVRHHAVSRPKNIVGHLPARGKSHNAEQDYRRGHPL